ncbi:MAG: hypothetical protein Q7R39_18860 [Dehalococcoidia bacterium]|nr:hypothetical protein [Dehalococcoidia bacterium]
MQHKTTNTSRLILGVTSLLIVAAAVVWLAGCSGPSASKPAAAPSSTPAPAANAPSKGAATAVTGEGSKSSPSPAAATSGKTQPRALTVSDQGQGGVTVKATWIVPGSPEATSSDLDRYLAIKVAFDTHSGDLTQYNLAKLSALRDDKGKELAPEAWQGTSDDSHHREGIIRFPRGVEQGSKYLELLIKDVGGVKERVLRWDLG